MDSFQDTLREQDAIFYATFPAAAAAAAAHHHKLAHDYSFAQHDAQPVLQLNHHVHHRQLLHHAPYPAPYQLRTQRLPLPDAAQGPVPVAARSLPDYVQRPSAPPPPEHVFRPGLPPPASPPAPASPSASPQVPPSVKRVQEKKPPLACLFCRGRKIACGSPLPGSTDKTCNQCQRRSLPCEYPSESRRGMRKKKTAPAAAAADAPAPSALPPDSPPASTPTPEKT